MNRWISSLLFASLVALSACGGSEGDSEAGPRSDSAVPGTGGDSDVPDPHAAARATCLDKINELRATAGKAPLAAWTGGQACADAQATSDQQASDPHGAFGECGESGQNECLGHGPSGVENCLQGMWDERLLEGCSGCAACADAYTPNCPDCDFYGTETGDMCGHYVNMNAEYFSEAACGFSEEGGWVVINFR